jgi:protein O-GlcNAc transferase
MLRGAQLHAAGQLEQALIAFEKALALQPGDVNAASACATLLSALSRPVASYKALLSVEAFAAGNSRRRSQPGHRGRKLRRPGPRRHGLPASPGARPQPRTRSLNNVGLMAAAQAQWEPASNAPANASRKTPPMRPTTSTSATTSAAPGATPTRWPCLKRQPTRFPRTTWTSGYATPPCWLSTATSKSPAKPACALTPPHWNYFKDFLGRSIAPAYPRPQAARPQGELPDARQLYTGQAFEAMTVCDWRDNERVTATLRQMLDEALRTAVAPRLARCAVLRPHARHG